MNSSILPFSRLPLPAPLEIKIWERRYQQLKSYPEGTFLGKVAKRVGEWNSHNPEASIRRIQKVLQRAVDLIQRAKPILGSQGLARVPAFQIPSSKWSLDMLQVMGEAIAEKRAKNVYQFMDFYAYQRQDYDAQRFLEGLAYHPIRAQGVVVEVSFRLPVREVARKCRAWLKENAPFRAFGFTRWCDKKMPHPPEIKYFANYAIPEPERWREIGTRINSFCVAAEQGNEETLEELIDSLELDPNKLIVADPDIQEEIRDVLQKQLERVGEAILNSLRNGHERTARRLIRKYPLAAMEACIDTLGVIVVFDETKDPLKPFLFLLQEMHLSPGVYEKLCREVDGMLDEPLRKRARAMVMNTPAIQSALKRVKRGF